MTILQHSITQSAAASAPSYQIARSVRCNSPDTASFSRILASTSNRKTFTWSGWVKRSKLSGTDYQGLMGCWSGTDNYFGLIFVPGDNLTILGDSGAGPTYVSVATNAVFRDFSAWYHVVMAIDTTQATAANRRQLWVNGVLQPVTVAVEIAQNYDTHINWTSATQYVGSYYNGTAGTLIDGYMAEVYFVDGQALDATYFGQTNAATGIWSPKAYTGTYGTNGYYLNFADNSGVTATTLGKDSSGNGNNWTPNNFSVTAGVGNDSLVDSPTNYGTDTGVGGEVRGNYSTWNPLAVGAQGLATLYNGNLQAVSANINNYTGAISTFAVGTGKWYAELYVVDTGSATGFGIINAASLSLASPANYGYGQPADGWLRQGTPSSGAIINSGASATTGLPVVSNTNIIMMAVDFDAGKIWFGVNGTWDSSGNPVAGTGAGVTFTVGGKSFYVCWQSYYAGSCYINFGQRPFSYTAPSGFKALCTTNLPAPAVTQGNTAMDVALYTGTGANLSVSSLGFAPDLVWLKGRSGATDHAIYDRVRGVQLDLVSNTPNAETTQTTGLTAFNSNGFSIGTLAKLNTNAATYAGWAWKANGAPVSNTSGSITSQVSANTAAGVSIVTYTGTGVAGTVGHGLGVAPKMILSKSRNNANADSGFWDVYHIGLGSPSNYLKLNTTDSTLSASTVWNGTAPTASVYSVGTASGTNAGSSATYVAYCFAEVAGFSKFGSYTGNGSADGPFVYCGFRPRFFLWKPSSAAGSWAIYDAARNTYNVEKDGLYPNLSNAEADFGSSYYVDFLSNGFKIRGSGAGFNGSGETIIFAAFAETPFNYARAR